MPGCPPGSALPSTLHLASSIFPSTGQIDGTALGPFSSHGSVLRGSADCGRTPIGTVSRAEAEAAPKPVAGVRPKCEEPHRPSRLSPFVRLSEPSSGLISFDETFTSRHSPDVVQSFCPSAFRQSAKKLAEELGSRLCAEVFGRSSFCLSTCPHLGGGVKSRRFARNRRSRRRSIFTNYDHGEDEAGVG